MTKHIVTDKTQDNIVDTVREFAHLVCATMGPSGKNIMLHNDTGTPIITKDGVTVARAIDYDAPEKKIVAQILKQAAESTNQAAGDGTTTSTCIARAVVEEVVKLTAAGHNSNVVRQEILNQRDKVLARLAEMRVDFSGETQEEKLSILNKIAMVSTNGDGEIATLVADAVLKAGPEGLITVKNGFGEPSVSRTDGVKVPHAGFTHAEYARGTVDQTCELKDCYILITTYDLDSPDIIKVLQPKIIDVIREESKSLLIIGKADKAFLENMIKFNSTGQVSNCIAKPPYFGEVGREMMDDIAAYVGGIVVDQSRGHKLENIDLKHLGYADKVVVGAQNTTIYGATTDEERMEERLQILKDAFGKLPNGAQDLRKVKERLASLSGNVYILSVPTTSTIEDGERLDRIEDAINACRGALEDGYLPGGGVALYNAADTLGDSVGEKVLKAVTKAPICQIVQNAGESPEVILDKLGDIAGRTDTYDARNKRYGNAFDLGIIDSYKVISSAFKNGISIGSTLVSCVGQIADKPQENANPLEWY